MKDEGFRPKPYLDTIGIPTIGYGTTTILGRPVSLEDPSISAHNARQILRGDLYQSLVDSQHLFERFDEMDNVRQEVIANMAYNLGRKRLGGFKRMIAAAEKLDYDLMADEMVTSRWFLQVGSRAMRLSQEMRDGITS